MSGKFKTAIDLPLVEEVTAPEQDNVRVWANDSIQLTITDSDGENMVLAALSDVPTELSQLTNDANYVADDNYVHTDNNYTTAEKNKLAELSPLPIATTSTLGGIMPDGTTLAVDSSTGVASVVGGGGGGDGHYVRLACTTVTTSVFYITYESLFDSTTYSGYVVYFEKLLPLITDGLFCLQFKSGTGVYNATTDYVSFCTVGYGTQYTTTTITDKWVPITNIGAVAPVALTNATGVSGYMFISATNTDTSRAQLVAAANVHTSTGGPATYCTCSGGLNVPYDVDGFRLMFSSGKTIAGTVTIFGVKKL
jgi:hypothetical protein